MPNDDRASFRTTPAEHKFIRDHARARDMHAGDFVQWVITDYLAEKAADRYEAGLRG